MTGCKTQQKKYILAAAGFDPMKKEESFKQNKKLNKNILIESTFLTNFKLFRCGDWLDIPVWFMTVRCETQEKHILAAVGFDPMKKEESFKQNKEYL